MRPYLLGELVHLEDVVLHDAGANIRTPTHELTIARDVLRSRRRIASQSPGWALSLDGLRTLRQASPAESLRADSPPGSVAVAAAPASFEAGEGYASEQNSSPFDAELAMIGDLPPILQAIVALDAWNTLDVLQHAPWLGRYLAASILRQRGVTTGAHLAAINLGLKTIPVDWRRHRNREIRLLAIADGLIATAEIGLKEHDRLALVRKMMERKLQGRRLSSKLPELVDLVMATPLVHAGMITKTLGVTPQAARRTVTELGLREMTGRGRFRAWGVI
ncbi:DUF1612 domain-containing protein [Ensifer adhaerens]|nr:DUF1612 domain-containing protein [Ensifer adhaerens]